MELLYTDEMGKMRLDGYIRSSVWNVRFEMLIGHPDGDVW